MWTVKFKMRTESEFKKAQIFLNDWVKKNLVTFTSNDLSFILIIRYDKSLIREENFLTLFEENDLEYDLIH
ncbi:hypothetical protein EI74_0773 [Mycoplasma testudineum]|uniref:Uncharacterized protein n=1 Tax=Mycoplasma testudineum TaxID=244584 RepID=A0A4R6IBE6_9MOLU|nr:hypothetical protein [Mycoplasma testudineum]OYD26537.1 hypothetical protein CG473_03420 [Mycoplasma testudineum]TDO19124.1 hypothetical protein EI74_0773 [Mycoplasma testudineum]